MINISFTEQELAYVLSESVTVRLAVARHLQTQQNELSKLKQYSPNETSLLANFKDLVRSSVRPNNKIQWIKNTRQWASDNKAVISADLYNRLYSLVGAKDFVEAIMGLPRY
jgi:hypothetical protein